MTFAWPWMLLTLMAVPGLAVAYRRVVRRRALRRAALAELGLGAPAPAATRRRHVAPALFLGAFALLAVAAARPAATVAEPRREGTVILAFDVSTSMAAKDLAPTRLEAAKSAARAFTRAQPSSIRLGVVAFGESGVVAQRPTLDRSLVLAAIGRLRPQGGTSVGRGIQTSLSAIAGRTLTGAEEELGYFRSAVVVLLTDGENTSNPNPQELADLASTAGVRIYPVGLGSSRGAVLEVDGFLVATALHEEVLRQIAETTNGRYFRAGDAASLQTVYDAIDLQWTTRAQRHEVTSLFAAAATLLVLCGATASMLWFGRVV
jgi:Ca-activated chloride channel family protein